LLILNKYPNDIIMHDGWLTGGHGVHLNLKTVQSLKDKGLVGTGTNQRITELGKEISGSILSAAPATEGQPQSPVPVKDKEVQNNQDGKFWVGDGKNGFDIYSSNNVVIASDVKKEYVDLFSESKNMLDIIQWVSFAFGSETNYKPGTIGYQQSQKAKAI
jgi:hypothetical protein